MSSRVRAAFIAEGQIFDTREEAERFAERHVRQKVLADFLDYHAPYAPAVCQGMAEVIVRQWPDIVVIMTEGKL